MATGIGKVEVFFVCLRSKEGRGRRRKKERERQRGGGGEGKMRRVKEGKRNRSNTVHFPLHLDSIQSSCRYCCCSSSSSSSLLSSAASGIPHYYHDYRTRLVSLLDILALARMSDRKTRSTLPSIGTQVVKRTSRLFSYSSLIPSRARQNNRDREAPNGTHTHTHKNRKLEKNCSHVNLASEMTDWFFCLDVTINETLIEYRCVSLLPPPPLLLLRASARNDNNHRNRRSRTNTCK